MIIRTATAAATSHELLNDLRALVSDAELMLNDYPTDTDDGEEAPLHGPAGAARAYPSSPGSGATGGHSTAMAAAATVRNHPYKALALAFGTSLLVGVLLGRPGR